MATTFTDLTGDGGATKPFSFPSIKEADIKVEVDAVDMKIVALLEQALV